jgi:hypothetical protein
MRTFFLTQLPNNPSFNIGGRLSFDEIFEIILTIIGVGIGISFVVCIVLAIIYSIRHRHDGDGGSGDHYGGYGI